MDRVLHGAFAQWAGHPKGWEARDAKELLIAARKEIADQRAVMEAQAKIISLLWLRQKAPTHPDDIVADYSSLGSKMMFYSD